MNNAIFISIMGRKININESQKGKLFEAYSDGFTFDKLTELGKESLQGINCGPLQIKYCTEYLGYPFAEGSSRIVYTLSDNIILKLAYGLKYHAGIEQNKFEWKLFQEANTPLLPRIFACDDNFTYLVSESVNPAEYVDFEKILGIPYTNEYMQRSEKIPLYFGKEGDAKVGYNDYFDDLKGLYERYNGYCVKNILAYITYKNVLMPTASPYDIEKIMERDNCPTMKVDSDEIERIIKETEWFSEVDKLSKKFGLYDFGITNFGIVNRNGTPLIVILDSGFNLDIFKKYYLRR